MRLADKIALVTGAGSGFGEGIARTFAREGAKVAVVDINEKAAQDVAAAIGASAIAVRADVSKRADVEAAVHGHRGRPSAGSISWSTMPASRTRAVRSPR